MIMPSCCGQIVADRWCLDLWRIEEAPEYDGATNHRVRGMMMGCSARAVTGFLVLVTAACATNTSYAPADLAELGVRDRAVRETRGHITVTVAVPSPEEARRLFGFRIDKKEIQPIWLEIENRSDREHWFFVRTLDPEYFSPLEVAWMGRRRYTKAARQEMERSIFERQMPLRLPASETSSGFVFANQTLGARRVFVELIDSGGGLLHFDFMVPVPGLRTDYQRVDFENLYAELVDLDEEGLREWIREQPCCATNARGDKSGDPLNLVVVGSEAAIWPAFVRAGWNVTEVMTGSSIWKTVTSSVFRRRYFYSPVSSLFLFGRPQDIALQKARGTVDERNHLRLWLAPVTCNGHHVFIGQISRDIGIRFTTRSPTISTHKIDPDVDETRAYLVMDLASAQGIARFGNERGVGPAPIGQERENLTGDPYVTDGLRAVLFMSEEPIPLDEIEYLDWEEGQRH